MHEGDLIRRSKGRGNVRGRYLVFFVTHLWSLLGLAHAENATTPGPLALVATFQSIGVRAPFSGDQNGNNSAAIQFRRSGATLWSDAYTPILDRRATINGVANPYPNEARGSIVGLNPDTDYEVRVTWNDVDGSATQPLPATIRTLSFNPPGGGTTIAVTNDTTLANALSSVAPGQKIHLNPGTYNPFTINRSGTAQAWITIEGDAGGGTMVSGIGVKQNLLITGNYVVVSHLTLGPSDWSGIVVNSGHVFIQDNTIQDVAHLAPLDPPAHYGDAGVAVRSPDVYVLRNTILSPSLNDPATTLSPRYDSPGFGIDHGNQPRTVYFSNSIAGGFRDGIGGWGSGAGIENVDIAGNTISGVKDDSIELDGDDVNVRIWGNSLLVDNGLSAISNAPTRIGPSYLFRNTIRVTANWGAQVFKLGSDGILPTFIIHNSLENSSPYAWDGVIGVRGVVLNNILKNRGLMFYGVYGTTLADYNDYWRMGSSYFASKWGANSYATFTDFRSATGQEMHGKEADPLFIGQQLHIAISSPAYDAGMVIPNFNDLASAWPYAGQAPDIGAWEAAKKMADFSGDGKADLIFRHPSRGDVILWLMNGWSME